MGSRAEYVSLLLSLASGRQALPDTTAGVLARLLKCTPEEVRAALQRGTIKIPKALVNRDLDKLVEVLGKSGLDVKVTPVESEITTARRSKATQLSPKTLFGPRAARRDDHADWNTGDVIEGLYEVQGSALGGMGKVYFIFHRLWKMMLAIKTPLREFVQNEIRVARFLREAELWVNLGLHPNIATCYYARVIGGLPRLFIEYVDGGSLDDWLKRDRLKDLRLVTDLMIQFCHGMMHAEEKGLIHRDIKPANCLISSDGILKITDFGLVKRVEEPSQPTTGSAEPPRDEETGRIVDASVTMYEDGIMGSPWYMPPERFLEKGTEDIRADIYSFGVMLYELTVGPMPFQFPKGFTLQDLVKAHLRAPPVDPLSVRPDFPRDMAQIILTCLAKKPQDRYPSFSDVAAELEKVYGTLWPGRAPRPRPNVVGLKADSLNNQAVSLLDLGRTSEAIGLLEDAYSANTDHLEAVYNLYTLRWVKGLASDQEVVDRMESLKIEVRETPDYAHFMGLICLQRGDPSRGAKLLKKACAEGSSYGDRWNDYGGDPRAFVRSLGLRPVAEQASFAGHVKTVRSVGFAENSLRAYSVGEDRSVRVWDVGTGRCLKNFRTSNFVPVAGAFSADAKLAATGYGDSFRTLDLWDVDQGRSIRRFQGMAVLAVAFSPTTGHVAAVGADGRIRIHESASDKIVWSSSDASETVGRVSFVGQQDRLALGALSGNLIVMDYRSGRELFRAAAHDGPINTLAVSRDGSVVLSGGADEGIKLWEVSSGKQLRGFAGHHAAVTGLSFTPDGAYFVSVSADGTMKIWGVADGRCYRTFSIPGEELTCCAVSPDGKMILGGGARGAVRLWSFETGWFDAAFIEPAICRPKTFTELSEVHQAFQVAVDDFNQAWRQGDRHETLEIFERVKEIPGFCWSREAILMRNLLHGICVRGRVKSSSFIRAFHGHRDAVVSLAAGPDSMVLLSGGLDGKAKMWDVVTGRCFHELHVDSPVAKVVLLPRLHGVLTWSRDGILRRWDLDGRLIFEIPDTALPLSLADEGRTVALMGTDRTPNTLDIQSGKITENRTAMMGSDFTCFSEDLATLYSVRDEKRIQRWSVMTGRNTGTFRELGVKITAVLPTADDERVIAGMENGDLVVYVAGSGVNVVTFRGHRAAVRSMAWAPDGRLLVSGSDDCCVRVWDVAEERGLSVFEGHASPVRSICFFPNLSLIASGGSDGSLRLWGLEWELTP